MWWALEQEGYVHQKLKELGGPRTSWCANRRVQGQSREWSRPTERSRELQALQERGQVSGPLGLALLNSLS